MFYDDGQCLQNKLLLETYKANRKARSLTHINTDLDAKSVDIFREIRRYYYLQIKEKIEKEDICSVIYSHEYETDIVPFYAIKHGYFESDDPDVLNIILSLDKDLLQITKYKNTIQAITAFKANKVAGRYEINFRLFDDDNSIEYIYPKFKRGIVTAKYIPLVLSLMGDASDDVMGLPGIGPAKAVRLIEDNDIPWKLSEIKNKINSMPSIIKDNIDVLSRNMKVIDFEEQIKRLPLGFFNG